MACFFVPSGIQPLKEKLNVFATADLVLAWIPFFALIAFLCVKPFFSFEHVPMEAMDYGLICFFSVCFWYLQFAPAFLLRLFLKMYSALVVYAYYFCIISVQCGNSVYIFLVRHKNLNKPKEALWPMSYYFLVGLITFYAALIPYRIYELVLVIYFHYLSKKNQNPQELKNVVVEINGPPPPSQKS